MKKEIDIHANILDSISDIISPERVASYTLPVNNPDTDVHVIPVSGGADSAVAAILMVCIIRVYYPNKRVQLLFTDTLAEEEAIYDTLDALEEFLDVEIVRLVPEKGLYEEIESNGCLLPDAHRRWCTRMLKLEPFEAWLNRMRSEEATIFSYVGIRADEESRVGLISKKDWIQTCTPFMDLGIGRTEVYKILERTIGVPALYRYRTRSGCHLCFAQRKSELLATLRHHPAHFHKGIQFEDGKLTEADKKRFYRGAQHVGRETGIGYNHLSFPIPVFKDFSQRPVCRPAPAKIIPINQGALF